MLLAVQTANGQTLITSKCAAKRSAPIPPDQREEMAGKRCPGDGLSVTATPEGARLHCLFQRLAGEATPEGLWLTSVTTNMTADHFRMVATAVGRKVTNTTGHTQPATFGFQLAIAGRVSVDGDIVRFHRPGLTEEYSVSVDGVRQDFVITSRPAGTGELCVELALTGGRVEATTYGAILTLDNSGRKIAYTRLQVTDAMGQALTAHMEMMPIKAGLPGGVLEVVVNDANAMYPVRIDPTFSDANWISSGGIPGVNSTVNAAVVDDSGNLYIGGNFTIVGDIFANHIAKWNGSGWSALGSGVDGQVNALAVSGSNLYVGGYFTNAGRITANGIAKWDGNNWSAMGSGMGKAYLGTPAVYALAASGSNVFAGGPFTVAGGSPANYIAKWDGSNWSALGLGMNDAVNALVLSGSDLYAGGYFTTAGGIAATNVAEWNGTAWSAVGSGMGGHFIAAYDPSCVTTLAMAGSDLYAGGHFTTAGGVTATNIAKWNGSGWSALNLGVGGGPNAEPNVTALAVSGNELYVGGIFTVATVAGGQAYCIAKWDGSNWSAVGSGVDGGAPGTFTQVSALAVAGGNIYAGGNFTMAGGATANNFAWWNGNSWTAMGSGLGGSPPGEYPNISALAVSGNDVYIGGNFTTVGSNAVNHIAKWNGSGWSGLGFGVNSDVYALAVSGSNIYAGGNFTTATNGNGTAVTVKCITKWDGNSWSALGSGMGALYGSPSVSALAVSSNSLYVGGNFTAAGGGAANYVAKWNGSSWTNLASGLNGGVSALAVSGSNVFAGGYFTSAANTAGVWFAVNSIARWNGKSWAALGSGMGGYSGYSPKVFALTTSGNDLYAGGQFTTATNDGGVAIAATNMVKWDGNGWTALGSGIGGGSDPWNPPAVYALAVSGSNVYAGGNFTIAGGSAANYIAKWDGNSWSTLGSGMNSGTDPYYTPPVVSALAISSNDLYAGGGFTIVGGKVSAYLVRAYLPPLPALSVLGPSSPDDEVTVFWPSPDTDGFLLEQSSSLTPPVTWVTNAVGVSDDGITKSVTLTATSSARFFRLCRP